MTRKHALILTVVVVAVAALVAFYLNRRPQPASAPPKIGPVYASQGQLTPGFPPGFIMDSGASLNQSYSITYNAGLVQRTTSFTSAQSMSELFNEYKSYFATNNWTITNEITRYSNSRGLYAVQGTTEAAVAVVDRRQSREVTVSYVVK